MVGRLRIAWIFIRGSLWFLPLIMGIAAVVLAVFLSGRRETGAQVPVLRHLLFSGDAESARSMLSALLSAMINVTGLIISITIVVLTLAAGQSGPRVIRHFIGDRGTQLVLGLFVAAILYLLMVLRALNGYSGDSFSHLAVSVGTALSALCVFVLLFFIHKLAKSIMVDNVVQLVNRNFIDSIDAICPRVREQATPASEPMRGPPAKAAWIAFSAEGYIQALQIEDLIAAARRANSVIWIDVRPGHYLLTQGHQIAVTPAENCSDELQEAIRQAVVVGSERTFAQDLEFGIRQLVELGLRALSPGINDPFTAIVVIDCLMSGLARLYRRELEASALCDADQTLRVMRQVSDYEGLVGAAFDQLRQAARSAPSVLIHLIDSIGRLATAAQTTAERAPLISQLDAILATARSSEWVAHDQAILERRYTIAKRALDEWSC